MSKRGCHSADNAPSTVARRTLDATHQSGHSERHPRLGRRRRGAFLGLDPRAFHQPSGGSIKALSWRSSFTGETWDSPTTAATSMSIAISFDRDASKGKESRAARFTSGWSEARGYQGCGAPSRWSKQIVEKRRWDDDESQHALGCEQLVGWCIPTWPSHCCCLVRRADHSA